MLHGGTLIALLVYFWRDVLRLIGAGWAAVKERSLADDPDRRLAWLLVVSVIPAALLGAAFESFFDTYFRDSGRLFLIPLIMVFGALLLWAAERVGRRSGISTGCSSAMPSPSALPRRSPSSRARAARA